MNLISLREGVQFEKERLEDEIENQRIEQANTLLHFDQLQR